MFTRQSPIKKYWLNRYSKEREQLIAMAENDADLWQDWECNTFPESTADFEFDMAITVFCGSDNKELANAFLQRTLSVIERIFSENKLQEPGCIVGFPGNRAACSRLKAYAEALSGEKALDKEALLSASRDYEEYAQVYSDPKDQNEQTLYYWLDSIHLALLGDDPGRADALFARLPTPFKHHKKHLKLLNQLLADMLVGGTPHEKVAKGFQQFFDEVRDPTKRRPKGFFMPTTGPLEIGLLREKFIISPNQEIDFQHVVEDLSA